MLRPFLEQRLYQTSTPAKLAEYWQAQVSTRGNDLSERVILAGNALPATPSEPVSRSHIAPAGGTKPPQKARWHGLRRRPTGRGRPRRPGNPASNHPAANPPPRPTSTLSNPMPARSRSGSSPHPGTLPLRRFHDGRPAGTPSIRPASDTHAVKSDAGTPSKKQPLRMEGL